MLGTPAYMSPEQAEGRLDLLGPASDVYSLGATLYVVLTGTSTLCWRPTPPNFSPKSNVAISPDREPLDPNIPKPLEAICVKAMALEQADRYATPRDLAEDVEHWLADEPVSAYPRTLARSRSPLVAQTPHTRHQRRARCSVLGMISAVGFAAVVTAKNGELAKQTLRAETHEQLAINSVKRFRDVVVEDSVLKNNPALEDLRKKLLKEPLAFFKSLREQLQADKVTKPEALAGWPRRTMSLATSRTRLATRKTRCVRTRSRLRSASGWRARTPTRPRTRASWP